MMVLAWSAAAAPAGEGAGEATATAPAPGWARQLGGANRDWSLAIAAETGGGTYTVGYFQGQSSFGAGEASLVSAGGSDLFVVRLDAAGELSWARGFGGPGQDEGRGVAVGTDGGIYVTGFFSGRLALGAPPARELVSVGSSDVLLLKLSPSGEVLWARRFGGKLGDVGYAVAAAPDGGVLVTGYFQGKADFDPGPGIHWLESAGGSDAFVARLDGAGRLLWAQGFGGARSDQGRTVAVDGAGRITVAGNFEERMRLGRGDGARELTSAGSTDVALWRLDPAGELLWVRRLGGPGPDSGESVAAGPEGGAYAVGSFAAAVDFGQTRHESSGGTDAFLARLDGNGRVLWARPLGGAGNDFAFGVAAGREGDVFAAGFSLPPRDEATASGESVAFVARLDSAGERRGQWAFRASPVIQALDLALAGDDSPVVTGIFKGEAKLDLGGGRSATLPGAGKFDVFVARLAP